MKSVLILGSIPAELVSPWAGPWPWYIHILNFPGVSNEYPGFKNHCIRLMKFLPFPSRSYFAYTSRKAGCSINLFEYLGWLFAHSRTSINVFVAELAESSTEFMNTKCRRLIWRLEWWAPLSFYRRFRDKSLHKLAENKLEVSLAMTRTLWCLYWRQLDIFKIKL